MTQRTIPVSVLLAALWGVGQGGASAADAPACDRGPWLARFQLTLEDGWRTEAAGPFYYSETKGDDAKEHNWAIIPFYSDYENPDVESSEQDILYPLFSRIRYGQQYRWQFGQLWSKAGGEEPTDTHTVRKTIYPFYFRQTAPDTNLNYVAYVPFYGHLKHRLSRDEIFFVMFPFYAETRKKDVITDNYLYPFVHVRHGDGLQGWQVWPIVGHEHKDVTTETNGFGDVTVNGGHDQSFWLFPFHLKQDNGIGTDNPEKIRASIPFYFYSRSPQRDSTTVLFPLFTWIDDRAKKYHEWQGPWPVVIFTRGAGKTTDRVWPLFSRSHNDSMESDSYGGPLYTFLRTHTELLDFRRTRVAFYLYENVVEKNLETGAEKRRVDMWPFFTWRKDFNGNEQLHVLSPVEPALPDNRGVERNWAPFWTLWRSEKNVKTGVSTASLLWNFYRSETRDGHKKVSLCFGLFRYESRQGGGTAGDTKPGRPLSTR